MPIELNGGAVADTTVAGECGELVFTMVVNREQVDVAHVIGDARVVIGAGGFVDEIGRAHVCTPVTNATLVCRILLEKKKYKKRKSKFIEQHKQTRNNKT